jgi:peptide deformylase
MVVEMKLEILKFPTKSLKESSEKIDVDAFQVEDVGTRMLSDLKNLIREMDHLVYRYGALGLAAPQVGINKRVIIVKTQDSEGHNKPISMNSSPNTLNYTAMVNPEIIERSENTRRMNEGCLSFPNAFAWVTRPESIRVKWFDVYSMSYREDTFSNLEASILQHECDHLDGTLLVDKLGPLKSKFTQEYFKKNR